MGYGGLFKGLVIIALLFCLVFGYSKPLLAANPLDVVINEVAWMGTQASSADEWIELYNNTDSPIDIGTWSVYGADTGACLNFSAADGSTTTTIPAHGFLIYANEKDDVNNSNGANIVDIWDKTIGLNNTSPGQLILYDAPDCGGNVIDTANQTTDNWFAGDAPDRKTMERKDPIALGTDGSNWATNDPSIARNGFDATGNPINGTPKARNSATNSLPLADAGPDQTVNVGDTVQLSGSGSSDPDGDPLSYSWSFISKPAESAAALSDPVIVNPTFIADVAGDYILELTVNDGRGGTDPDQVTVTAVGEGDTNGDGKIDMQDAILAAKFALSLLKPNEVQRKAADVVPPCGAIDVRDVVRIAEVTLGIRDESAFTCSGLSGGGLGMAASFTHRSKIIRLRIADKELLPGGGANIDISSSAAVEGIQVGPEGSLSFDPQVIQIRAIRGIPPFQVLASEIDNEAGKAKFMVIAMGGEPRGGGVIELEIEAVGQEGESTVVELAPDMALDAGGSELEVKITGGRLTIGQAMPLRVERVLSFPNPASGDSVRFVAEGRGIKDIQVQIYDLSGREVFASGWVAGETFEWDLMSNRGRIVANGVYLYVVAVRGSGEGELIKSKVKKLVVLR